MERRGVPYREQSKRFSVPDSKQQDTLSEFRRLRGFWDETPFLARWEVSFMNMFKMCFNPTVLAVLALVGVGLLLFAPGFALAALPLLVVAICPLSMAYMAFAMSRGRHGQSAMSQAEGAGAYTCPMHPEVQSDHPGQCRQCGMNLTAPRQAALPATQAAAPRNREQELAQLRARLQEVQLQREVIARQIAELDQPVGKQN